MHVDRKQRYAYLQAPWRRLQERWEVICAGLAMLLSIAFWPVPQWMVRHEYWEWQGHSEMYAKLVDDYRKTLVQIIGGAFLLYTLYLTQRRTKATEDTLRVTQKALEVTQETQITDRFTKAITQLGAIDSQGNKQIETRLGSVYALERIANDSFTDHWPIMELLTAYIRQNALWQAPSKESIHTIPTAKPHQEVQAIASVIARRRRRVEESERQRLNLTSVNLQRSILYKAHLERAYLIQAHLEGANLHEAHLEGAILDEAHLEAAVLYEAHLEGASLKKAHLEGATLYKAHLEGANLHEAHLEGVNLTEAVGLTQKLIDSAYGDHKTTLPQGLVPPEHWSHLPNQQSSEKPS